jgi:hypothetical protein
MNKCDRCAHRLVTPFYLDHLYSSTNLMMTTETRQFDHVRHILLAEFDIDRGSVLSHQYPVETGADER